MDFCCIEQRLIIELDGGHHIEEVRYDAARTRWIEGQGFRVLRFWNDQVYQQVDAVLLDIYRVLQYKRDA